MQIMAHSFRPVTHVLFDLDGLLLNSENIYTKIDTEICAKYGKKFHMGIKKKILGTSEIRSAAIIVEELKLPITPEAYLKQAKELQLKLLPSIEMMPGAERLMRYFDDCDVPMAVATGASIDSFELKTSRHKDIFQVINHVVAASTDPEVKKGKPAPDVFLVAASRFKDKPDPCVCLVFEDAPNGVKAANSAGMQVVMVPDKFIDEELRKNATLVIDSLHDFQPELFGLPPFPE